MTTSASLHATNTVHAMRCTHQRPLVKPDVRNYRIRLSDDPSAIGIRKELTAMNSQVDEPLGLQRMIQRRTAKLPTMPLAPRSQKATPPFLHIPVDPSEGRAWITETKVIPPATEKTVHLGDEFSDGSRTCLWVIRRSRSRTRFIDLADGTIFRYFPGPS